MDILQPRRKIIMIEITGNVWDHWDIGEVICITTNGLVKKNGEAVMGAGVALEAKNRFPNLPRELGEKISTYGNIPFYWEAYRLITFPVKHHWYNDADIELIKKSCHWLMNWLNSADHDVDFVVLVRPGCGNGKLDWGYVKAQIDPILDNRVTIIDFR